MEGNQSRRNLIRFIPAGLLFLFALRGRDAAFAGDLVSLQNPPNNTPPPPSPFGKDGQLKLPPEERPEITPLPKKDLKADDKDIRKQVALLAQYADELKKEVEKTDSTKVLSLQMLRKTQTIEKLAHHIASLASS